MTTLFFTTPAPRPGVVSPPPDNEPTELELQRWEDDGGAVSQERPSTSRAQRPFGTPDRDQVAA